MDLQALYIQVHDFLIWISECERTASSNELGQDYEHVQALQQDFHQFSLKTVSTGSQKVWYICDQCDYLVTTGHPESYTISMWRDEINESWEDLLELIDTRILALEANHAWHVFMHDCQVTLAATIDKILHWYSLMLTHDTDSTSGTELKDQKEKDRLKGDIASLKSMVKNVHREYKAMDRSYSGDQLAEIEARATDVISCWRHLKNIYNQIDDSEARLETNDLIAFLNQYTDLRRSIEDVQSKLTVWPEEFGASKEELDAFMHDHRSLKEIISSYEEKLEECTNFGSSLISQHHYASSDVENKLVTLNRDWVRLMHLWEQRFEKVQTLLLKSARSLHDLQTKSSSTDQIRNGVYASSPDVLMQHEKEEAVPDISYEGILFRKRLKRPHERHSINGGWKRFYCVLKNKQLIFYTNKRRRDQDKMSKTYPPLDLINATINPNIRQGRLMHVFSLKLFDGVEYVFQASNDYHKCQWLNHLFEVVQATKMDDPDLKSCGYYSQSNQSIADSSNVKSLLRKASPQRIKSFFHRKNRNGAPMHRAILTQASL